MNALNTNLVVGKVSNVARHPNADKLFTAEVDIGRDTKLKVIFGMMAAVSDGDLVPVAVAPVTLPTGLKIESRQIRGALTECMLCLNSEFVTGGEQILIKFAPDTPLGKPVLELINS